MRAGVPARARRYNSTSQAMRPDAKEVDIRGTPLALSAIVLASGNEHTIVRSVASLLEQDCDAPFEVIVVVTSDGDSSAEVVRQNYPQIRLIESPFRLTPGGMRNMGIEAARGEIVAFLHGDCVARPGWVINLVEAHRAGHEAVASAVALAGSKNMAARVNAYLHYSGRLEGTPRGPLRAPRSDGLSFSRELLSRVGPFDEALRTDEDPIVARRLVTTGVEPWFEPSVCTEVACPLGLSDLLHEQAALGRRQAQSDVVSTAPGSVRVELESRAPGLALALRTLRHGMDRSRSLAMSLGRRAPNRRDVVAAMPWIAVGLAANTLGWAREQYAYARTGSFTELDGAGPTRGPLRRLTTTTGEKTLMLTFDDGPSEHTPGLLRVLAEHDVPATFFVLGERVSAMPEVVRAITEAGHDLASHGWSHTAFTELDAETLSSEVHRSQDKIRELSGSDCRDVRPPYGRYNGHVVSWLADQDFVTWLWTADARDYEPATTVEQIVRNTLLSLTPGGIVLMHDGGGDRSKTVHALPRIIEGARERGFRFVALRDVREPLRAIGERSASR